MLTALVVMLTILALLRLLAWVPLKERTHLTALYLYHSLDMVYERRDIFAQLMRQRLQLRRLRPVHYHRLRRLIQRSR